MHIKTGTGHRYIYVIPGTCSASSRCSLVPRSPAALASLAARSQAACRAVDRTVGHAWVLSAANAHAVVDLLGKNFWQTTSRTLCRASTPATRAAPALGA